MARTEAAPEISGGALWFPGKPIYLPVYPPVTARGREIARSRDELIGLLRDVPECDYELSLTDLVEKKSDPDDSFVEEKTKIHSQEIRKSPWRKSLSDGVLLNVFVPVSLKRSLTVSGSSAVSGRVALDCTKRDRDRFMRGCWPALWEKNRGRSKRR